MTALLEAARRWGPELAWVVGGQALAFLGTLTLVKVLTISLGTAAYGELALGITIAGVLHMFVYGPLEQVVLRYVSLHRERGSLDVLFAALGIVHSRAAIVILVALAALAAVLHVTADAWTALVAASVLFGMAGGVNATLVSLHGALRNRRIVALHQAGDVWLRLLLAVVAINVAGPAAPAALLGFLAATACIAASQLLAARRAGIARRPASSIDPAARRRALAEFLAYGGPYVGFAVFAWLGVYADRWIILHFLDAQAVGLYAAAFQVANAPVVLFAGVTNQFLVPLIFDRAGTASTAAQVRAATDLLYRALVAYVAAFTVIVATAYFFARPLLVLLTSAEFAPAAPLLWLICAGLALGSIGQVLVIKGLCYNRPQDYLWPKAAQSIVLVAVALALVAPLGLTGIALALCVAGAVYIAAVAWANRRLALLAP